ncbi:uncharacterized protein LAESUDRAFT_748296 [Laetiporus sulphureus 93-53]|uniref:F-box domain-containing protein n=1 Tax=Laetiporus sulphureus 93-53 TaxID=1314785 RepID=A0A165G2S7_9APHY|nr:uncharacterized protein LAESUDRAFT_748296 [Laetiporus sulphureus 93-53]KZT09752.1 hypothetical protein LAESUDRAFT_748296 [Laetiporus sulphureus 93-53]
MQHSVLQLTDCPDVAMQQDQQRFPQELCEQIMDYLQDDQDALLACALVSRPWVPRARSYAFRTVTLRNVKRFKAFQRLLRQDSTIAPHVRCLSVCRFQPEDHSTRLEREWPTLLMTLNRVEEVTVGMWSVEDLPEQVAQNLHLYLGAIKSIRFFLPGCSLQASDFLCLVGACPRLSVLHLHAVQLVIPKTTGLSSDAATSGFMLPPGLSGIIPANANSLEAVHARWCDEDTVQLLLSTPLGRNLRRLEIPFTGLSDMSRRLVHSADRSLEDLCLVISSKLNFFMPVLGSLESHDFPQLPNLDYLHLRSDLTSDLLSDLDDIASALLVTSHAVKPMKRIAISLQEFSGRPLTALWTEEQLPRFWKDIVEALERFIDASQVITIQFNILFLDTQGAHARDTTDQIVRFLERLRKKHYRLGVVYGNKWVDSYGSPVDFGGGLSIERQEFWFDYPD